MNRKAWIKIIEAIVAILLIVGVAITIISQGYVKIQDTSGKIYSVENSILRGIQLNNTIRNDILNENTLSAETKVNEKIPNYLDCELEVCQMDEFCEPENLPEKDIYTRSIIISANLDTYNPKQLRLFCWQK